MRRGKGSLWVAASVMAGFFAAGCCQEQENQIKTLRRDNAEIQTQNTALRTQLSAAQERETETANRLTAELANKDQEINGLKVRLSQTPTRPAGAGGAPNWEHGLFGDKVVIGGDVLFDSGKDTLKAGAAARLDQIVRDLKAHYPNMVVRVYGHTDVQPIKKSPWDDNWELSANRSLTVARYLRNKGGINPKLIEVVAMGEYHPEGADLSKNRRVEIYVVKAK